MPRPHRYLSKVRGGATRAGRRAGAKPQSEGRRPAGSSSSAGADPLAHYRPGWSLPGPFFVDPAIYAQDLDKIWRTGWLFACHSCEIPQPGCWVALEVGSDSIIVVRGREGAVHAMHNVCRHRGSLICEGTSGQAARLICPYHQWAYDLDGRLAGCRGMPPGTESAGLDLRRVHAEEIGGLIFVSLAQRPTDSGAARAMLEPLLQPQGLERARVARIVDYRVQANWKLVWENNRECYHCNANHPQYIKANFDHYNADDATPAVERRIRTQIERSEKKWAAQGLAPTHRRTGMTVFPDPNGAIWYSANRTPLVDGWVSESMDGRQVAPLMGDYQGADVGTLRVRTLPNFWNHSSCDHAVSTRLLPAGPTQTAIRVYWLVDAGAVEGKDYRLEELLPFWQLTSEQDWAICERQQKGVQSSAYRPGPYSEFKEYNVDAFVKWYLKQAYDRDF